MRNLFRGKLRRSVKLIERILASKKGENIAVIPSFADYGTPLNFTPCLNKRAKHLALHSKKARVRKKNRKRLFNYKD